MAKRKKKTWCEVDGCEGGPFKGEGGLAVHMSRAHAKKKRGRSRKEKDDNFAIEIEKINDDGIVVPIRIKLIIEVVQE